MKMLRSIKYRSMLLILAFVLALVPSAVQAKSIDPAMDPAVLLENTRIIESIALGSHSTVPDDGLTVVRDKKEKAGITPQWASGGVGHTHQFLTARALEILKADKGQATADLLYAYGSTILQYSDWPDTYETDLFTFGGHFYDPATGRNYLNQTSPTALSRFKDHAVKAKSYYLKNRTASMQELGKALHYLEDAATPHHSANKTALNSNHTQYEDWVDTVDSLYTVSNGSLYTYLVPRNVSKDFSTYCTSVLVDTATFSKARISQATSSDPAQWALSADATLKRSQDIMAAFLYNFLRSVGAAN
jgi:phospholipase C